MENFLEKRKCKFAIILMPEPSQPRFSLFKNKKKERLVVVYGLFLCPKIRTTPMMAMRTNSPAMAGMKYWSATDCGCGIGVVEVSSAPSTSKDVTA